VLFFSPYAPLTANAYARSSFAERGVSLCYLTMAGIFLYPAIPSCAVLLPYLSTLSSLREFLNVLFRVSASQNDYIPFTPDEASPFIPPPSFSSLRQSRTQHVLSKPCSLLPRFLSAGWDGVMVEPRSSDSPISQCCPAFLPRSLLPPLFV